MSKDKLQLLSPLFLKYQADFEKNPRSRVFAPLAETYRKLGMTDKAMEILSQGIRFHPSYLMGYLGLAFCYYDLKQFNLSYSTLRPLVEFNRDNIRLQKLFSDICLELGKKEEALETLKYLLFINPRDKDVADLVQRIEKEVDEQYKPRHKAIIIPEKDLTSEKDLSSESSFFDLNKLNNATKDKAHDFDDWTALDLSHEVKIDKKSIPASHVETTNYDHWSIKKGDEAHNLSNETKDEEPRSYHVHLDVEDDHIPASKKEIHIEKPKIVNDDAPLVTHTLVDLYCGQGHIEKALEVLEKILLLNPNDQKTIKKIKEIQALVHPLEQYDEVDVSEEDGRRHLMSLIDEKLGPIEIEEANPKLEIARLVEEKLYRFLKKIQKRALDYQGSI